MFRLISLEILHHHVLGDTHLEFSKDNGEGVGVNEIYTSVIIGVNGIGKSYLMRAIADIFSYLDALSRDDEIKCMPRGLVRDMWGAIEGWYQYLSKRQYCYQPLILSCDATTRKSLIRNFSFFCLEV